MASAEVSKATRETDAPHQVQQEVVVVTDVPQPDKTTTETLVTEQKQTAPMAEKPLKPVEVSVLESGPAGDINNDEKVPRSASFKEETTRVSDLADTEKKALDELKHLIRDAVNKHEFSKPPAPPSPPMEEKDEKKESRQSKSPEDVADSFTPISDSTKSEAEEMEAKSEEGKKGGEQGKPEDVKDKLADDSAEDDGAKTVEAIEETVVAVCSSIPPQGPEASTDKKPEDVAEAEHKETKDEFLTPPTPQTVSIWGIPLLSDERSDVILLKFLRARDFKVKEALAMIKNTILWRKEFGIDELVEQDLGNDLNKAVFMHGFDKEGHPVCYNIYGEFQNKELYQKTFSDEGRRQKFLRWRIQFLEKSIRKLDFSPSGICTIVQVNDLKNSPGPGKWELRQATKQALQLLQDNYPEFAAKQIFINVPWWYLAANRMISPFLTQRTKSKFLFAGPSKSSETLLRYIAAEQIPVKYGGLSKDGEFGSADAVTEITVRPAAKHTVEFPVTEPCLLSWEVRVLGWGVNYGAEFVPSSEDGYTVIIHKARKVASSEEPAFFNSFKVGQPGKVVLTIDNPTSKKKKLLYRLKAKPSSD